jgi:effector-binding domain-containing protein
MESIGEVKPMKKSALVITFALTCGLTLLSLAQRPEQARSGTVIIQTVEPFVYFCIEYKGPYSQIQEAIARMSEEARHQNAAPSGPLMGLYYNSPEQVDARNLQWEVGFPVTPQTLIQPPLLKKEWSHTQVAVCLHQGAYEDTPDTIFMMLDWLDENGYQPTGPIMERYLDMNPAELRPEQRKTEVWIPCQKKT